MKKQSEDANTRDFKKCPACDGKNYIKGWGVDIERKYMDGKLVQRRYHTVGNYTDFVCLNCGWQRTDVP